MRGAATKGDIERLRFLWSTKTTPERETYPFGIACSVSIKVLRGYVPRIALAFVIEWETGSQIHREGEDVLEPTGLNDNLFQACLDSCGTVLAQKHRQNEAYQEEKIRFDDLAEEIREKLGKDERLYFRLEESFNRLKAMDEEWVYRAGFGGCMQVLRWMETILE